MWRQHRSLPDSKSTLAGGCSRIEGAPPTPASGGKDYSSNGRQKTTHVFQEMRWKKRCPAGGKPVDKVSVHCRSMFIVAPRCPTSPKASTATNRPRTTSQQILHRSSGTYPVVPQRLPTSIDNSSGHTTTVRTRKKTRTVGSTPHAARRPLHVGIHPGFARLYRRREPSGRRAACPQCTTPLDSESQEWYLARFTNRRAIAMQMTQLSAWQFLSQKQGKSKMATVTKAPDVMPQIALRLPSRLLDQVDLVVRRVQDFARTNAFPTSFVNRSTIIRDATEAGLGEILQRISTSGGTPVPPAKSARSATATKARHAAVRNSGRPGSKPR